MLISPEGLTSLRTSEYEMYIVSYDTTQASMHKITPGEAKFEG